MDALPLNPVEGALCCANRHSFDIARQGYVNLLGARDKRSKDPGDSKAMIAARHRFLEAGYFERVAGRIAELLSPHLGHDSVIVDAGCGEGYYLQQLRQTLLEAGHSGHRMVGFDVSKWAVQRAARRFPGTWLVASNRNIPLAEQSVDVVLDMFGFPDFESFARILRPGGLLLRVRAGPRHLLEMREIIYQQIKSADVADVAPEGFTRVNAEALEYALPHLMQAALADLLLMTPHLFRASSAGKERLGALETLSLSVDIAFDLFRASHTQGLAPLAGDSQLLF
jgi:23S rRNA (guanine745-N1)-methyltransferase